MIRLDTEAKFHFPNKNFKSTYKIKKNETYARRIRNRENEILSFELRLSEIQNNIIVILDSDIFSWEIAQEPVLIDNVEYKSIDIYLNTLIYELKIILKSLNYCNQHSAMEYKINILSELAKYSTHVGVVNKIISEINNT